MSDLLTDRIARVTRELNGVKSVGQARAAARAARAEGERGKALIPDLPGGVVGFFGGLVGESNVGVTESSAERELLPLIDTVKRVEGELPSTSLDTKPVDSYTWNRLRPAVLAVYQSVAGIEGALGQLATFDAAGNLGRSIKEAPGVFVDATKTIVKTVPKKAGEIVGAAGEGLGEGLGAAGKGLGAGLWKSLGGLWWILILAGIAVVVYFKGRKKVLG